MSGYMIAEVWCDECGQRVTADHEGSLRDHRAVLRDRGWTRQWFSGGRLRDLCPACSTLRYFPTIGAEPPR